jgi:hypothetical protein
MHQTVEQWDDGQRRSRTDFNIGRQASRSFEGVSFREDFVTATTKAR